MKYLKYFEQASAYEAYKSGSDFVTPNVSYVEENVDVKFNPYTAPASPIVVCTYNVTDISQETLILNDYGLANVTNMIVDGVEMEAETYYQFDTVGNHVVEFVLYDPTIIGERAFAGCTELTSVVIPDSVTSIGRYAFNYCKGLTSITIPNSVTSIENYAFDSCKGLTSITIPDSVTSIGRYAFQYCSGLTSITIPNSVTSISDYAFQKCSGLTSITIPNSVTSIRDGAFYECYRLTSITIPNSVTSISDGAFANCSGLTSITIPNSVTSIGKDAFKYCSELSEIICNAITAPDIVNSTFFRVKNSGVLKVPEGSDYSSWMRTDDYYLGKYNWTIQYI